jgi:hypothetical protein
MSAPQFAITDQGEVYRRSQFGKWIKLGHIAYVLNEGTALAQQVREWWQVQLASDEPTESLVIPSGGKPPVVLVSETCFKPGWQPRQEPAEAALAAA